MVGREHTVRTMLRLALAAAVLGGALGIQAAPGLAQTKTTITLGVAVEPPHLDPSSHVAGSIREIVYANVYEGLMLTDENGKEYPALAEKVEGSADGKRYTFRLRKGVVFHDGTPFDSAVVRFSLDRARAPESVNAGKRLFEPIDTIETPDPHTVIVTLKRPVGAFLYHLGSADAIMVAPNSADANKQTPVGTGPFKFDRWVKGDRIELVRFDGYYGEKAKFTRATFRIIPDAQAQVAALRTGEVDAFPVMGAPETLAEFKTDPRFRVVVGQTQGEVIVALNHRRKPYDDVRVRRALSHALDRKAISEGAVAGYGPPIGSHFPPFEPDYVDLTGLYPHDAVKARKLLAEAGYPTGFEAKLILPPFPYARRAGEIVQAMLAEVGVRASIAVYQGPQWLTEVFREAKFDMTVIAHTEPRDIDVYAREEWYIGYKRPEFRALAQELGTTMEPARRSEINRAMQRMLAEDAVVVFLFQLPKTGVWAAGLRGLWQHAPVQANDLRKASWAR
jgi:peptide/nickel transport system substrate-binding protein